MESLPETTELPDSPSLSVETGEEVSPEISSPESPPEEEASIYPQSEEEFNRRVEKLCEMMEADPKVRDRLIAETYVNFASAEMGIRGMFEMFQSQGMAGLMKGAFRRGGRD
jgi:hypothetical protein